MSPFQPFTSTDRGTRGSGRSLRHWIVAAFVAACGLASSDLQAQAIGSSETLTPIAEATPSPFHLRAKERIAALWIPSTQKSELLRLYPPERARPLWLDELSRPSRFAREALAMLSDASNHALDPADYQAGRLSELAGSLHAQGGAELTDPAIDFELGLSLGILTYWRHVQVGRVDPQSVRFRIPSRAQEHDYPGMLLAALAADKIRQTAEGLAPPMAAYRHLQTFLVRYRGLAAHAALPALDAASRPPRGLSVGDPLASAPALRARLAAFGDLAPGPVAPGAETVYDAALSDAVKRFQRRHGLAEDGVLGKGTWDALAVPMDRRVRQIELAMERLRWLPRLDQQPLVAINIPMFRLWAHDPAQPHTGPPPEMAVIVGRALNTQTPVFTDEMTHIIFRPYWNVPRSIVNNEILPDLARDPGYLQRHEMEIVSGGGDDAQVVAASAQNIQALRDGALRLRQRPGARNSLGLVKFVFPNDANIYLHGTPATQLFGRTRRDFSHGCVRLEDPVALAQWALHDQPEWTRERILAAMQGTVSQRVDLKRPVRVILYYVTAMVMPADGKIHFAEDIYRHDRVLDAALSRKRPS